MLENDDFKYSRIHVYKHESISAEIRWDLMDSTVSSVWLSLGFKHQKRILVGGYYREWQHLGRDDGGATGTEAAQLGRWRTFLDQWETALQEDKEVVTLGDFNLDWPGCMEEGPSPGTKAYRTRKLAEQLAQRIMAQGVSQLVRGATRSWPGQADSCLDLIFTNQPQKTSEVLIQSTTSDHNYIQVPRSTKGLKTQPRYVLKRSYRNFCEKDFLQEVERINWLPLYLSEDPNVAARLFEENLGSVLDRFAPLQMIQTRNHFAPWLSEDTKSLMAERSRLREVAVSGQAEEDWASFRQLRNKVNRKVKEEKVEWQRDKLKQCEGNPKKIWGNVQGWLGWKSCSAPTKLYSKDTIETSPKKNAEIMNNYFINKVRRICAELPPPAADPLATLRRMMRGCPTTFQFTPVGPDTVSEIISSLKSSKSCGLDNVDSYILMLLRELITAPITHIVNLSLSSGVYPASYKVGKVVPLYKGKGDTLEPAAYRPVCLLPVASKIIERCVFLQMVGYMEGNSYFHPNHHGFRAGHSTATALLQLYDGWMEDVDKQQLVGACMIDLSAAFDVVNAKLLVAKLAFYGFSEHTQKWTQDYMSGRSQRCYLEGSLSPALSTAGPDGEGVGVPQGSILGPLFYVIFTNELPEVIHNHACSSEGGAGPWTININRSCQQCGTVTCYADDSTYSTSAADPAALAEKISSKYSAMSDFLSASRLKVNDDKTHTMLMTTAQMRRRRDLSMQVTIGGETCVPSEGEKLLGIEIHKNLKWGEHIMNHKKSLIKALTTRCNALAMISRMADFTTRRMIANGIWNSKLCYCLAVFGGTEGYLLAALQRLQNKAARLVCRRGRRYSATAALREVGWMPVASLVDYYSLVQAKTVLKTKRPIYLYEKLVGGAGRPAYATRLSTLGNLHRGPGMEAKLSLTLNSWRWRVRSLWGEVPLAIRRIDNMKGFKTGLKAWLRTRDK
jgi:hypothetical protein